MTDNIRRSLIVGGLILAMIVGWRACVMKEGQGEVKPRGVIHAPR